MQADDDRTRPRTSDPCDERAYGTRTLPRDRSRGRRASGAIRTGRAGRAGCPGARGSGAGSCTRSADDDDVPGEPGGIAREVGDREHEVVRSGEQLAPGDPVHDVARPPHVLDGRAVELEVDGRWIDAEALVGRGHGDAQHVTVAQRRAGFGLRLAEYWGCRVGHREARAPDGAIADSVDGAPRERVGSGRQRRCRPRGGAARARQ